MSKENYQLPISPAHGKNLDLLIGDKCEFYCAELSRVVAVTITDYEDNHGVITYYTGECDKRQEFRFTNEVVTKTFK
jgi:hypothetical protein